VGRELAIIRSGEAEPAPETYRAALRDVIRRCVYAADKNPLAIDLCKVALWIEGHSPGLPLSFLDHRIRCGDSLVGVFDLDVLKAGVPDEAFKPLTGDDKAVCAELRRINRRDRGGELAKFSAEGILTELAGEFAALADMPDETPGDVRSKEELYGQLKESDRVARLRHACDAWTAAFFAAHRPGQERTAPTTADVWNALAARENPQRAALIDELSDQFHFFHWRLEFPEVFAHGGFNVMLGNPPWERLTIIDQQYFSLVPQIADEQNAKKRQEEISRYLTSHPDVQRKYIEAQRESERYANYVRDANRFPDSARGELNLYPLFSELFDQLSSPANRAGFIVKSMLFTGSTWAEMTLRLVQSGRLERVIDFKNWKLLFPTIGYHERYSLVNLSKPDPVAPLKLAIGLVEPSEIANEDKTVHVRRDLITRINPETGTLPSCGSERELKILERVARELPTLFQKTSGWPLSYTTGLHMTGDVAELRDLETLAADGYRLARNHFVRGSNRFLPVYEGKLIHQYDHRFGTFEGVPRSKRFGRKAAPIRLSSVAFENPEAEILPRYWVSEEFGRASNAHRGLQRDWAFCFRDTTNVISNFRTAVAAIVGDAAFNYKCPNVTYHGEGSAARELALFLAMFNSVPFDFLVRSKFYGANFTKSLLDQCFVVPRSELGKWEDELVQHAVSLSCLSSSVKPYSIACGINTYEPAIDRKERLKKQAAIDAIFFYLFGFDAAEITYVFSTFRIWEEQQTSEYGSFVARDLALGAWDRFAKDGTFDLGRLRDSTQFDAVQRALVETRGRVKSLERELQELLARSDATPLPTLFVEGESDVAILTAAWRVFHPTEPLPVTILAARGTRQMESLAGRGAALRQLLGDRLVFALADNDREGRALVEDGRTRRGGMWRQQSSGIHWCLLAPTAEFEKAMKRFGVPDNFWPFTIENAFPASLRRQAMAEGAYAVEEATVQAAFLEDPATAKKALAAAHQFDRAGDDSVLYFRPPAPETKLAFAEWIAARERRDRTTFSAFGLILEELRALAARQAAGAAQNPQVAEA